MEHQEVQEAQERQEQAEHQERRVDKENKEQRDNLEQAERVDLQEQRALQDPRVAVERLVQREVKVQECREHQEVADQREELEADHQERQEHPERLVLQELAELTCFRAHVLKTFPTYPANSKGCCTSVPAKEGAPGQQERQDRRERESVPLGHCSSAQGENGLFNMDQWELVEQVVQQEQVG